MFRIQTLIALLLAMTPVMTAQQTNQIDTQNQNSGKGAMASCLSLSGDVNGVPDYLEPTPDRNSLVLSLISDHG
jgi:hypothetical protein